MSPYFFVLGMERLAHRINKAIVKSFWKPIKLSKDGPSLFDLFLADGLILFSEADVSQASSIMAILDQFAYFSSHKINKQKTQLCFSPHTSISIQNSVNEIRRFKQVNDLG